MKSEDHPQRGGSFKSSLHEKQSASTVARMSQHQNQFDFERSHKHHAAERVPRVEARETSSLHCVPIAIDETPLPIGLY